MILYTPLDTVMMHLSMSEMQTWVIPWFRLLIKAATESWKTRVSRLKVFSWNNILSISNQQTFDCILRIYKETKIDSLIQYTARLRNLPQLRTVEPGVSYAPRWLHARSRMEGNLGRMVSAFFKFAGERSATVCVFTSEGVREFMEPRGAYPAMLNGKLLSPSRGRITPPSTYDAYCMPLYHIIPTVHSTVHRSSNFRRRVL